MDVHLTTREAAEYLGIKPATWQGYVSRRTAPPPDGYHHRGNTRKPYWHVTTIDEWAHWHPGKNRHRTPRR